MIPIALGQTIDIPMAPMPYMGEIFCVLCSLFWASSSVLFRVSGEQIGPITLNLFKNIFAFILFLITTIILGIGIFPESISISMFPENIYFNEYLILIFSGYLGLGIADSLYFASLNRIGAGYSAIIDCSYSIFMVLGAYMYLGEPLTIQIFLALLLVVGAIAVGTWKVSSKECTQKINKHDFRMGILFGTLSMFFVSVGIIFATPVLRKANPIWANTFRMVGGIVPLVMLGLAPWYRKMVYGFLKYPKALKSAIPGCLLGNYFAMIAWFIGMKYALANVAGILTQLSTIFILLFATLFLHEELTWRKVIAILMGFTGGAIIAI